MPGVDLGQLERLLSFMSEHGLEEFEYAHGDLRIRLKKAVAPERACKLGASRGSGARCAGDIVPPAPATPGSACASAEAAHVPATAGPAEEQHLIKSPIVGTYYAGPNPEAPPFVKVRDVVEAGPDRLHHRSHEINE